MNVIVSGSRFLCPTEVMIAKTIAILEQIGATCVFSGKCSGGDMIGERAAIRIGLPVLEFATQWDIHGLEAGRIRNQAMIDDAGALVALPGDAETADIVKRAHEKKIPVYKYKDPY